MSNIHFINNKLNNAKCDSKCLSSSTSNESNQAGKIWIKKIRNFTNRLKEKAVDLHNTVPRQIKKVAYISLINNVRWLGADCRFRR